MKVIVVPCVVPIGVGVHLAQSIAACERAQRDEGLFLRHAIGYHCRSRHSDPWIATRVFRLGRLSALGELAAALEPGWLIEDWHNFGPDYDRTLMAWHANGEAA